MSLSFDFVATAIVALLVLFIVERVFRNVQQHERRIEMLERRFLVSDERIRSLSTMLKKIGEATPEEQKALIKDVLEAKATSDDFRG